jgi:hydroxyacylglutathione hydrolase
LIRLEVYQFPCLRDNYGFLAHDPQTGATASIDTPDVEAIEAALQSKGWHLSHILNTHHHPDHAGGNIALKQRWNAVIIGPRGEKEHIPGIDQAVGDGDSVTLGTHIAKVLEVPGHTRGHIAYWFADDKLAFVGDTIFAMGCGRVFEGTHAQMWDSLQKLMALPDDTTLYCAHEYTQSNARFALSVEPQNEELQRRARDVDALRALGKPTVPTTLRMEKATNPFFRAASADLQGNLGMRGAELVDVFAETRKRKDKF